jgi:hypothetical protein
VATPVWPLYFARAALPVEGRVPIAAEKPFPFQDKATIRGFGPAYGVPDADRLPFAALPYVRALNVRTAANARYIRERDLTYREACALLAGAPLPEEQEAAAAAAEAAAEAAAAPAPPAEG